MGLRRAIQRYSKLFNSIIVAAETYRLLCVFVGHAGNKIDEVWQQISIGEGSSERDEIYQVYLAGVDVPHHPDR